MFYKYTFFIFLEGVRQLDVSTDEMLVRCYMFVYLIKESFSLTQRATWMCGLSILLEISGMILGLTTMFLEHKINM
jgi:hypothetical protein